MGHFGHVISNSLHIETPEKLSYGVALLRFLMWTRAKKCNAFFQWNCGRVALLLRDESQIIRHQKMAAVAIGCDVHLRQRARSLLHLLRSKRRCVTTVWFCGSHIANQRSIMHRSVYRNVTHSQSVHYIHSARKTQWRTRFQSRHRTKKAEEYS
jgi:hypothetical protein